MKVSKGKFAKDLNDIEKILKKIDFLEERNYYPSNDFDASVYRSKTYNQNWESLISDNIYNFMLSDNSILYFKLENDEKLSFSFYECPYLCLTYKEYLIENQLDHNDEDRTFIDYYELYVHQCDLKENPIMIRYDLDYNSYYEGLHPVSHIHIGHKTQVRLGAKKILSPKSFFNFVMRQNYPVHWKRIIKEEDNWKLSFIKEKSTLKEVKSDKWNLLDKSELFLS